MFRLSVLVFVTAAAFAQPSPETPPPASLRGVVKDAPTGDPVPDVSIAATGDSPGDHTATTDEQGKYELRNLPPGTYRVSASVYKSGHPHFGQQTAKYLTLGPGGQRSLDLELGSRGKIAGKVLDEKGEPLPGIQVRLVAREYTLGKLRHVYAGTATTDDQGEYLLESVRPDRAYLVMAEKWTRGLAPASDAPADPKLRRPVYAKTFYPESPTPEGAQAFVLRPGEKREGADIVLRQSPNLCVEGQAKTPGGPQALFLSIEETSVTSGAHGNQALFITQSSGKTGPDGKFRICGLQPGEYEITTVETEGKGEAGPPFFGTTTVSLVDQDVWGVLAVAQPLLPVRGEVVWDEPPAEAEVPQLLLSIRPLARAPWRGQITYVKPSLPGSFLIDGLALDEYSLRLVKLPKQYYVKDMRYGGSSIVYQPLRVGSELGDAQLRIVIGTDAGHLQAKVTDAKGNPVPDAQVVLVPEQASTEAEMAAMLVTDKATQDGVFRSGAMRPGKYYAFATTEVVDLSPESIAKIWGARGRGEKVEIQAGETAKVQLEPLILQ